MIGSTDAEGRWSNPSVGGGEVRTFLHGYRNTSRFGPLAGRLPEQDEYNRLQGRIDTMYVDKLDGRIDAAFFDRMAAQWRDEQARCLRDIERHQNANRSYLEEGGHLLALAQSARRLFDRQEAREKRRLLDFVASNCSWKGGELAVIYTNPLTFLRKRRPLEHDRNYLSRWGFRRGVKADSSCWLGWRPAANAKALLV